MRLNPSMTPNAAEMTKWNLWGFPILEKGEEQGQEGMAGGAQCGTAFRDTHSRPPLIDGISLLQSAPQSASPASLRPSSPLHCCHSSLQLPPPLPCCCASAAQPVYASHTLTHQLPT
eukprot:CAMPEP_0117658700 /NCGR_PEP_ID=MMETSP0804-20121206/6002_1 /TAXON_ID=1074897 /ORGANISM="Tetraselmis astigmatica, Strain CCMP880" /LENGTH=116 /DNA_ID=CAMNT_0005465235 /DNA_START=93 /DNA_END=439 /DNA_ORIENTATION=+